MPDEAVTLTMRAGNAPVTVPGSETDTCDDCGEDVVVSPATQQAMDRGKYPTDIRCLTCATDEPEPRGGLRG
jgi:ribosomal protein S27E